MELHANGPTLVVGDEVDENGAIDLDMVDDGMTLVYGALTVRQAEVLVKHLTALLKTQPKPEVRKGSTVRILRSHHADLIGKVGLVTDVFGSGNLQVRTLNTSVVLAPSSVELA